MITSLQNRYVLVRTLVKKCAVDRLLIAMFTLNRFFSFLIVKKRVQFVVRGGPFLV